MRERLRRLNRLRESWAQRKKSTEYRIAAIANEISRVNAEEEHLVKSLDGDGGTLSRFPDLLTRRLSAIGGEKGRLAQKMESAKAVYRSDSMNLRRCEIFQERQKAVLEQKEEAAQLESTIEVFLQQNP